jgi:peptidoglycan-N-acetylglucosamine deacetylase
MKSGSLHCHTVSSPTCHIGKVLLLIIIAIIFTAPCIDAAQTPPVTQDQQITEDTPPESGTQPQKLESSDQPTRQPKTVFRYRKFSRGNPNKRQVALTFDDGPHYDTTPMILSILKKYNVKATFFVVGEQAERFPNLIRAEAKAGHSVANHTYNHLGLKKIPDEYIPLELEVCGSIIRRLTGTTPHLFRPPGGGYDVQITEYADSLGYTTVLWTLNSGDYECPSEKELWNRVVPYIHNGSIILFHDGVTQTINILPKLLQHLKAKGYEVVTVDEMIKSK